MLRISNSKHALPAHNGLGDTRTAARVEDNQWVPLGLVKRLGIREERHLSIIQQFVGTAELDGIHLPLFHPRLYGGTVGFREEQCVAAGRLEQSQLSLCAVAWRDE